MSQMELRSAAKKKEEMERDELEGPYYYSEKPTQVIQGGVHTVIKQLWNAVKNVDGMEKSEWTEWAAKGLIANLTKFREFTDLRLSNDEKIQHLINSITENTDYRVEEDDSGPTRQIRLWIPIPKEPQPTNPSHLSEQDEEEDEKDEEEEEQRPNEPTLAQPSMEQDDEESSQGSKHSEEIEIESDDDINKSIVTAVDTMTEKLEQLTTEIGIINATDPSSQDTQRRNDMIESLTAVTHSMAQILEAIKHLDKATRANIRRIETKSIANMNKSKKQMKEDMKKELKKDMGKEMEKMMEKMIEKERKDFNSYIQSQEQLAINRLNQQVKDETEAKLKAQQYKLDEHKELLILDMEQERNDMGEKWKKYIEQEKQKINTPQYPLPYHPPGAPTISTPFNTNVPVSQAIKHTNTPRSPGRQAKLTDYDKPDTYIYEGSKFTVRPQLLIDSVNNIPTLKDKDDIIYVYTAIHTVARTSGVLLTTPATIQIYTMHHPYPTTFGIRSDAESNPNVDFQASVSLNQLYKLMDRALYNLLTEVISEDYYEAKQIMDNAARDGEGYKALYMLLKLCLPRLNPMVAPTVPPLWTQGTELTKFVAKVRSYKDFDSNFDDETAIRHILQHVPEDEYPGVATVRGKYQAYVDAKETYDIQYSNIPNPPLPPPLPGDVSLAYIAYNINKNPVNATTRRMIAEEINKHPINAITRRAITEEIQKVQATMEVEEPTVMLTRRTGTKELCKACGTYGHQVNIDGCDQLAMVQNCLKFRQLCKKNNEESTIKNIHEKYKNFNEDKKKKSQEMSTRRNTERGNGKNDRNTERRSRSRDRTRITRLTSANEDSDSLYTDLSDDEYSFDTSDSYDRY
ncbi:predicted protein [Chaetoceros tenuissimus]|uniref:Uncharacterized protein n=1 Tax=Chaetoceros tenuissimus TaxID=426638 RepID=A0AAD3HC29_9STRA|nr:predicted protein [Chaetoceros tenuissimus]